MEIGCLAGSLLGGLQAEYFGRKKGMVLDNVILLVGTLFIVFANRVELLYVGRLLCGYGYITAFINSPVYTAEVSQPQIRKVSGTLSMVCYTCGFFSMYLTGAVLPWRYALGLVCIYPVISILLLLLLCPESPYWRLNRGERDEALRLLLSMRGDKAVAEAEFRRMQESLEENERLMLDADDRKQMAEVEDEDGKAQMSLIRVVWGLLRQGPFLRPFLVLLVVNCIGQQGTGFPVLAFYMVKVLNAGRLPIDTYWFAAILTGYRALVCVVSMAFVPRMNRRPLCILSMGVIGLGNVVIGIFFHLANSGSSSIGLDPEVGVGSAAEPSSALPEGLHYLIFVGLFLIYTGHSGGFGHLTCMLQAEILPSHGRTIGCSMVYLAECLVCFLVSKFLPQFMAAVGLDWSFWIFSAVAFAMTVFAFFCIPESNGKSLEEMEDYYRRLCYGDDIADIMGGKIKANVGGDDDDDGDEFRDDGGSNLGTTDHLRRRISIISAASYAEEHRKLASAIARRRLSTVSGVDVAVMGSDRRASLINIPRV